MMEKTSSDNASAELSGSTRVGDGSPLVTDADSTNWSLLSLSGMEGESGDGHDNPVKRYRNVSSWLLDLKEPSTRQYALDNFDSVPVSNRTKAWNQAWKLDLPSTDRQKLLSWIDEGLPNKDRVESYRAVMQTKNFVGAIPASRLPSDNGITMKNWTALAEALPNEQAGSGSPNESNTTSEQYTNLRQTLIKLISYIDPPDDMGNAWINIAQRSGDTSQEGLAQQLLVMEYDTRTNPYFYALHNFKSDLLPSIVAASPPDQLFKTLEEVLKLPAGPGRRSIVDKISLPDDREQRRQFIELALSKCTDEEMISRDFVKELSPSESNLYEKDYAGRFYGFSNLASKLHQDYFWSQLKSDDFKKLGFLHAADKLGVSVEGTSDAAQDVFFRYTDSVKSAKDAQMILHKISKSFSEITPTQLVLDAAKSEPPKSVDDIEPSLAADMALRATTDLNKEQISSILNQMGKQLAGSDFPSYWTVTFASALARRIASQSGGSFDHSLWQSFSKPIQDALNDQSVPFSKRQELGRQIALCARESERDPMQIQLLDDIVLPSAKLPPRFEVLENHGIVAEQLRNRLEEALWNNDKLQALLGNGELGKLFPDIFGTADLGGIVDRKQHDGHDLTLDAHTFLVLHHARENPEFKSLSSYDQRNLLLAALLHDISKRQGERDPEHERISAGWADGVLTTLGYSPEEVTRISTLISRHGDLSFANPYGTKPDINDAAYLNDLTVFYSNPAAMKQLRILNEADIKAVKTESTLWTPETKAFLDRLTEKMAINVSNYNKNRLPILTTALPRKFDLVQHNGDYAFYAHSSTYMDGKFWDQLSQIESNNTDLSASLVTNKFGSEIYKNYASVVALLKAPPENIAAAYHGNLGTGWSSNWSDHVKLANKWTNDARAKEIADQVAKEVGKIAAETGMKSLQLKNTAEILAEVRKQASFYNSLDEVLKAEGESSFLYRAEKSIQQIMTSNSDGTPLNYFDEVKINNPTVAGLGIYRRGKNVIFEGLSTDASLKAVLKRPVLPGWVKLDTDSKDNTIVIPKRVWIEAQKRHLPFVALD